jgi:rSAM/selenodomain-associated transferase 2
VEKFIHMDDRSNKPELSIIVPAFNEAGTIRDLVRNLAAQEDVFFEVILCDGGSADGTPDRFREAVRNASFSARIINTERGRGRQMNGGAAAASGSFLLFLHVDSFFNDPNALRKALDSLGEAMQTAGHLRVAGRFALHFDRPDGKPSLFYYYHECKAGLDRGECIHGDQGFLLHRSFFSSAGPFGESMGILEDTSFAETVRGRGTWILFPSAIYTSARRFETEGCAKRETLNAIIMTLAAVGRKDFLDEMPRVYAFHGRAGRLRLYPFFAGIRGLLRKLPFRERMHFWYRCGSHAVANMWQIAFFLDVWRNFRNGIPPGKGAVPFLLCFDRFLVKVPQNRLIRISAGCLVWFWFHCMLVCGYVREKTVGRVDVC